MQIYDGMIHALASFGHAESIVTTLTEKSLDYSRKIYRDNSHSSVPVAEYLFDRKTYYCGTLKQIGDTVQKMWLKYR